MGYIRLIDKIFCRTLLIAGIITNTLPRYLDLGSVCGRRVYYIGQALSYLLILMATWFNTKDKITYYYFEFTLILAISNFWDELFCDPTKLGVNELIFGIIALLQFVCRLIKRE